MSGPTKAELQEENEALRSALEDVQEVLADTLDEPQPDGSEEDESDEAA